MSHLEQELTSLRRQFFALESDRRQLLVDPVDQPASSFHQQLQTELLRGEADVVRIRSHRDQLLLQLERDKKKQASGGGAHAQASLKLYKKRCECVERHNQILLAALRRLRNWCAACSGDSMLLKSVLMASDQLETVAEINDDVSLADFIQNYAHKHWDILDSLRERYEQRLHSLQSADGEMHALKEAVAHLEQKNSLYENQIEGGGSMALKLKYFSEVFAAKIDGYLGWL